VILPCRCLKGAATLKWQTATPDTTDKESVPLQQQFNDYSSEPPLDVAQEKHYTIGEIAERWHCAYKTVQAMFVNEPGVLVWGPGERRFKRSHRSMRVPESVMIRVHRRNRPN
jgi:hypothetical protein